MTGPEAIARVLDVSRETLERLETHHRVLSSWNRRINLVAGGSLADAWRRHYADSAQLWPLAPDGARSWIDLGAGAGFPGLVIAAIAAERAPELGITLVEADARKAAFLATAAREMSLAPRIVTARIEALPAAPHDVVSARALAPLPRLLALAHPLIGPATVCLFPKGADAQNELTAAETDWHYRVEAVPSLTDPRSRILRITGAEPRRSGARHQGRPDGPDETE